MTPNMKAAPNAKANMVGAKAATMAKAKVVPTAKANGSVKAKAKGPKVKKEPQAVGEVGGKMTAAQRSILVVASGDYQK